MSPGTGPVCSSAAEPSTLLPLSIQDPIRVTQIFFIHVKIPQTICHVQLFILNPFIYYLIILFLPAAFEQRRYNSQPFLTFPYVFKLHFLILCCEKHDFDFSEENVTVVSLLVSSL